MIKREKQKKNAFLLTHPPKKNTHKNEALSMLQKTRAITKKMRKILNDDWREQRMRLWQ